MQTMNTSTITNINQMKIGCKYLINFFDTECSDTIEDEFSPHYNGMYMLKDIKQLPARTTERYDSIPYLVFENDKHTVLHIAMAYEYGEDNYHFVMNLCGLDETKPLLFHEYDVVESFEHHYDDAFCTINEV